ncbi:MAG: plasmid mobilization relaxosome protein MobC [Oscillospiraceae bacterium]|nr:plasmid mobilization relaxosome protein MobC [Oscillospiraceae bacterium]
MKKRYEICLRLNEEERLKLYSDSQKCGLSKTVYLRCLIMNKRLAPSREKELRKLIAEINKIGSNVNQVARAANTGQLTKEQSSQLIFLLGQIYRLVEAIARR